MFDVIVVGARVAGSATAMQLARGGLRVLLLERDRFPKDILNGNAVLAAGVGSLRRLGMLDRVLATGVQPFKTHAYEFGPIAFAGTVRWPNGAPALEIAPRRYVLDTLLAEAAAEAGAELRQEFSVDDVVWDGGRMIGVRGRDAHGATVEERAQLVIGADGMRSRIASAAEAPSYETRAASTCVYYSHWSDLPTNALEVYALPGAYAIVFPSNDGLTCVVMGWSNAEFARVRADVEGNFMRDIDRLPALAARVRAGRREEHFRGTADLPMYLRRPYGPGWALVGDAGCRVDPITGQGITDALRDAELLSEAVLSGLGRESTALEDALSAYQRRRDAAVLPIYRFTADRASLKPLSPRTQELMQAVAANREYRDQFAGLTAGTTAISEFFAPDNLARIVAGGSRQARPEAVGALQRTGVW